MKPPATAQMPWTHGTGDIPGQQDTQSTRAFLLTIG